MDSSSHEIVVVSGANFPTGQVVVTDLVGRIVGADGSTHIGQTTLRGIDGTWNLFATE